MLNPSVPLLKPQVVAPGVNIRSSVQSSDTSYQAGWSGTSMSAPHVSGLVALLWQAAPDLRGDYVATETIIEQSATPITYTTGCASDGTGGYPNCATGGGDRHDGGPGGPGSSAARATWRATSPPPTAGRRWRTCR
jgi:subtilisin family serine protease